MNTINNTKKLGYFIKRNDISNVKLENLLKELQNNVFEAKIIKQAIEHILLRKLFAFDCTVGDWKCQTRATMIIDLINNTPTLNQELSSELPKLDDIINHNITIFNTIKHSSLLDQNTTERKLKEISLQTYLQLHNLDYYPSEALIFLSLCFLTTTQNTHLSVFTEQLISVNKLKEFINIAKKTLCQLSINYEKNLAYIYGTTNEQKALNQIEHKGIQQMTSLFCSFKSIYKKTKSQKQSFIIKHKIFCSCGGIKQINISLFDPDKNITTPLSNTPINLNLQQPVTIIIAYQYPGSLINLKNILDVPNHEPGIPKKYVKPCYCSNPSKIEELDSIETAIMAFFAQHPQFTNNAQIDFETLGLVESDLQKEYSYLISLPGFSVDNMTKFHILHMHPSTIRDALELENSSIIIQSHGDIHNHKTDITCPC